MSECLHVLEECLLSEVKVGWGFVVPNPLLKAFTACPCQERKEKNKYKGEKKKTNCKRGEGGGVQPPTPQTTSLLFSFVTHRHHLPLLPHQTKMRRVGSAGSRPATSPPSGWQAGGCGGGSFSEEPPERRPLSHSSPSTPAAASPVALHYPSDGQGEQMIQKVPCHYSKFRIVSSTYRKYSNT